MRIIVVEDDYSEYDIIRNCILTHIPDPEITNFPSVEHFLMHAELTTVLEGADVIVMEKCLPLIVDNSMSEEDFGIKMNRLRARFPDVAPNWDSYEAGERVIRWLRRRHVFIPVVLYTHSEIGTVPTDILNDKGVFHCKKTTNDRELSGMIMLATRNFS